MLRSTIVVAVISLSSFPAQALTVGFCAPPDLREAIAAELVKQGREPLDLSELDDTLFGPQGIEARLREGKAVTLAKELPQELKDDFAQGLAGCRARAAQTKDAKAACAEHLVSALWERQLARLHPALVMEFKPMPLLEDGSVSQAVYSPGDATIGAATWPKGTALSQMISEGLLGLGHVGARPNVAVLPEKTPLPPLSLRQGAPQTLTALELQDQRCKLPARLEIEPANAPLAITMSRLWELSVKGHVNLAADAPKCSLKLEGKPHPSTLVFHCRNSVTQQPLFVGSPFADPVLQATLARRLVAMTLHQQCELTRAR